MAAARATHTQTSKQAAPAAKPQPAPARPFLHTVSSSPHIQAAPPAVRLNSTSAATGGQTYSQTPQRTAATDSLPSTSPSQPEPIPTFKVTSFDKSGSGGPTLIPHSNKLEVYSTKLGSSAKVEASGDISAIANWDVGYIQNVLTFTLESTYEQTDDKRAIPTLPMRDGESTTIVPWMRSDTFTAMPAKGGAVSVSMSDYPSHVAVWDDPRIENPNSLIKTVRSQLFKTWLIARHRVRDVIFFLKRFSWLIYFVVDVDKTKPISSRAINSGSGLMTHTVDEGQGPVRAVLTAPIINDASNDPANRKLTPRKLTPGK